MKLILLTVSILCNIALVGCNGVIYKDESKWMSSYSIVNGSSFSVLAKFAYGNDIGATLSDTLRIGINDTVLVCKDSTPGGLKPSQIAKSFVLRPEDIFVYDSKGNILGHLNYDHNMPDSLWVHSQGKSQQETNWFYKISQ